MASEVLKGGGHGFVAKIDAGSELLKAVRTVCAGGRFVSQHIVDQGWEQEAPG
jgi:DNA-binding NarL/FixJ family response regulator